MNDADMFKAIVRGDTTNLKVCLSNGGDPNALFTTTLGEIPALMLAFQNKDSDGLGCVRVLCADPNIDLYAIWARSGKPPTTAMGLAWDEIDTSLSSSATGWEFVTILVNASGLGLHKYKRLRLKELWNMASRGSELDEAKMVATIMTTLGFPGQRPREPCFTTASSRWVI